jgi:hypothetical protein
MINSEKVYVFWYKTKHRETGDTRVLNIGAQLCRSPKNTPKYAKLKALDHKFSSHGSLWKVVDYGAQDILEYEQSQND